LETTAIKCMKFSFGFSQRHTKRQTSGP